MKEFIIEPLSKQFATQVQEKIDNKIKPLGALGRLEEIALQIATIQQTLTPALQKPYVLVFAGDHGIAVERVSAYPQEVTAQMVLSFVRGKAAINVFCQQHHLNLKVIDAGVAADFPKDLPIVHAKIAKGTRNFLYEPAMTQQEMEQAIQTGSELVKEIHKEGCNVVGFGEMGIANTSSASAIMSVITKQPVEVCVGRGTGLNDEQYRHKIEVLRKALLHHQLSSNDPFEVLRIYGGYEIAMMCGAMLQAAALRMLILVDGFISSIAFLIAYKSNPYIRNYAIFCHTSAEQGHLKLLEYMQARPILQLGMRLGEGSACAIAYPVVESAVRFLNEMASFEEAGVSNRQNIESDSCL
ncbi:nicotinate-nucleotide--dimethylbenzimidazole phosphoribosyltransferase [Thermonema lapsum]|uniref:Nicotinate-nucleotide--dimethylbenzimidazole phosphoribosyltransferase n=1 Tax=Thermonema lapsum TaxID=28195 RepID=A0A846MSU5_9BACT|nr:nicotinate-nucleotide--dimethylbenzimidazole phosphoribosyltransferase [Thermonema lapsum]NIK74704.1 nicotinate-nucleotide--dimethylbenzimidazole phosphoribosyltransferase [Thermonema lapsum]